MKFKFFALVLVHFLVLSVYAENAITYTASAKLNETSCSLCAGIHINAFTDSIVSHTFSNGTGTITFSGELTRIGDYAFQYCSDMTSITIPSSVTSISGCAFWDCNLTTVIINSQAIARGRALNVLFGSYIPNFVFGDSVTSIGASAFSSNPNLITVTMSNSVKSIGDYAFYQCENLRSIAIPNGVTHIGDKAFYGCYSLYSITLPDSLTSIGTSVFSYTGLKNLTIPGSVKSIGSRAFQNARLHSVTIQNGVKRIGDLAFFGCSEMRSIAIPNSVTSIGEEVFWGCRSLTSIILPDSVTSISNWMFRDCISLSSFTVGNRVTSIGRDAFRGCTSLASVVISNSVTSIKDNAFLDCVNLKAVYNDSKLMITKGWTNCGYVGYYADTIYTGVRINDFVIKADTLLTAYLGLGDSVVIPASITKISDGVFQNSPNLTEVTIPNSVKSIGFHAFFGCDALNFVTINSQEVLGKTTTTLNMSNIFGPQVASYVIGDSVTSIGNWAFRGCSGMTSIQIPSGVTSIGSQAFSLCSGLTSIAIPADMTSICTRTFYRCTGITAITIPNNISSIGEDAFYGCTGLTSIVIPESMTSINDDAFYGCTNLKTVYNLSLLDIVVGAETHGYVAYYADDVYNCLPSGISAEKEGTLREMKKVVRDGQVLIQRGDRLYDLRGQEVR